MKKQFLLSALICMIAAAQVSDISGDRIRAHVKFLASDLLEGRGVGTRGGRLATEYIATQFALVGAKPAGDHGTFFQRVPMVGAETQPDATLSAEADGKTVSFRWLDDYVGVTEQQKPDARIDAEAVFVGHGIVAPEFHWDDFKGADVKGKVLILFTNEPPSNDPAFFGGKALTYYGRWTYKYEEAARMGAAAVFIIHTTPTAGYGYDVVKSSWGKEDPQLRLETGQPALGFAAWMTEEAGQKLLGLAGKNVQELLKAANSRDFRPIPLGIRIRGNMPTKLRDIESRNVAAVIPGSDPELKSQVVMYTAHWDHLGIGPAVNGDRIYNGAVDNATGCAMIIEIARAWEGLKPRPKRSALFLAVTAEEAGLRGSEFYGEHPIYPLGKTALDLNFDAFFPFGATKGISISGAERTTVWPTMQHVASGMNLEIEPESHPEQGHYYRSDHFSLARFGVPAFSISLGSHFVGKPADFSEKTFREYNEKHYHQPSDEYREDWDMAGMEEAARFGLRAGVAVADQEKLPTWKAGDEFLGAREKSGVK